MVKFFSDNKHNPWFWMFVAIAAILFFAMPLMSRSAGNSGDEDKFQIPQGRFVVDYFRSDGADTTCLQDVVVLNGKEQSWNLKYYGCSFDVVTEWINRTFGIDDIARTRHMCNAFLGWLIVLFGGLIAYRMGGWRAGVFAMLLLFFSPRLLGHSFNNPKDIPLAAGVIMSVYYMLMFFRQLTPQLSESADAKGKKGAVRVQWPEPAFSDKVTRYLAIFLMVLVSPLLFTTAGVGFTVLIVALFVCLLLFREASRFNPLTLAMLALSIALAVSNRIGGLIVVGYMGLWGLLWLVRYRKVLKGKVVGKAFLAAVLVCLVGFFSSLCLWPFALQQPVHNSIESFRLMSQFDVQLRQLFEGSMVMSNNLPWYYTPKFMLMTIPLAVLVGWLLYPFFGAFKRERRIDSIMIYFVFLFPVFWIVATGANVYGGWRHSLFAYPPMAVAAGLGFDAFAAWAGRKSGKGVVELLCSLVPLCLLVPPALHTVRNHPYEYVYFNELAGGVKKAFGHYELDYYYHSMREATEWVMDNAEPKADGSKTLIGSWHLESTRYFMRSDTAHFDTRFVRWGQRYEYDWDYLVFPITGIAGDYLLGNAFPPKDCVHTVDVDGKPIALVLKRQTKDDFHGVQLLRAGNADSAAVLFRRALQVNADNETALSNLANICLQQQQFDQAADYCNRMLAIDPSNPQASQMLVYAYLYGGKQQEAATLLDKLRAEAAQAFPFTITADMYARQGNVNAALNELNTMLDHGLMDQDALQLYVQLRMASGTDQNAAVYSFYSAYANGLEKKGDVKAAEELRKQLAGAL
ncbi:MAG: tetratricopeptide repeat protein [Bacteroidales bacterium]|nr:tetratricopeptide repeat protein [Bacteroidales bacterium]